MGNRELLENLGIRLQTIKKSGKTNCPKCGDTPQRRKKEDLSVNIELGKYNCHNPLCDFHGVVGTKKEMDKTEKEYAKPVFNNRTNLSEATVKYFQGRCIGQDVLNYAKVTEGIAWMPQFYRKAYKLSIENGSTEDEAKKIANEKANVNTVQFNYFRNGELINTKFRGKEKSFRMVKDAELIFYNYDEVKDVDWCIIVEGEPDCLSFMQCGIKNVISVPNGASTSESPNLDYLDNCFEIFDNKTKIVIATDSDEPGFRLRGELARRLGYERCFKVDFKDCKDANEYLKFYGEEELRNLVSDNNLIEFPISGIITANDIWSDVEFLLENGLSRGDLTGILDEFDENVSFQSGHLMVLTGIPNHGKSPFALMIMCALSINHGWKWGLFTPEHHPLSVFIIKICECLLGKRVRNSTTNAREREMAKQFINKHFYFIRPEDECCTVENILEKARMLVLRKGINGLLIDPWNKLEHNMEKGEQETSYVSRVLDDIIRFDQKHNVFSIIIAHPQKIKKDAETKQHEIPSLYDIAGSANWFNKPDIGITFYRNYKSGLSEVHIQKMKYEHLGSQGLVKLRYNVNNSRFANEIGLFDNSNWLLPKEEQKNIFIEQNTHIIRPLVEPKVKEEDEYPF